MIPILRSVLRRSFDGAAWHGPALADVLRDVDVDAAFARPLPDSHAIAEIVHHLTAWTREVTRRLDGATPALPVEGDWPAAWPDMADAVHGARWDALRAGLHDARTALLDAVGRFPEARLGERVGTSDDPAIGGQASFGGMLIGLAEHNAYHGGQIVMLHRASLARRSAAAAALPAPATLPAAHA